MPEPKFWAMFKANQAKSDKYLKPGDVITATIAALTAGLI